MKKLLFLFVTSLFLLSCNDDNSTETTQGSMDFEVLFQSSLSSALNLYTPQGNVVMSLEELNEMHNTMLEELYSPELFIDTDFSTNYLLIVFDKVQPDTNYYIKVESIYENANSVDVFVVSFFVDGVAATVPVEPFTVVRIPKTNKPINFIFN
nr:hypothetical protein [uncultured Flavobacterium sp.]